ncbi:hypothetical protein SDC9_173900 [bioreactor metagenome]|uniref:Uncharacterized protein n=1 Tax=bioreactor metagenome TaxID=1076179 RepID=A0A645GIF1_9ZZZZ
MQPLVMNDFTSLFQAPNRIHMLGHAHRRARLRILVNIPFDHRRAGIRQHTLVNLRRRVRLGYAGYGTHEYRHLQLLR